jgi:hypothetical protein
VTKEKGTALLEIIVVGFAVVLLVLPVITTVARLTEANATVNAAARDGAVWVARHGGEPPQVDGVKLSIVETSDTVEVVATQNVTVIGVGGTTIARTVRSRVAVSVGVFRSTP